MRSATTASQTQALALMKDLSTHLRVSVDDGSGNYADLTDLEGYDWIHSVQYTLAVGVPVAKAAVKLKREAYKLSLSPFMDGSKLNAGGTVVDIARKILIETALLPRGKQPASNEWEKVFRGYIEKIGWAKNPIVLSCQDLGAELLGRFVETQLLYAETDNLLHEVIQDIVDDTSPDVDVVAANFTWNGTTTVAATGGDTSGAVAGDFIGYLRSPYFEIVTVNAGVSFIITNPISRTIPTGAGAGDTVLIPDADRISLYVEGANPTWAVHVFFATKDRVLSWCRKLAQQIGYEVSYRWNSGTGDFELTLWTPDRSASTPDVTIGPGIYKDFQRLDIDRSKVRNRIKITAMVSGVRTTVVRENAGSKLKYGTRYIEVVEKFGVGSGHSSQIDTVAEMNAFGDVILSDLKDPGVDAVVPGPYRWDLQPADYARFSADDVRFDTDQDLGIVSLTHTFPNIGEPKTVIAVRGKPSGGVNRWLELEGMPGVAAPVDLRSDESPTGTGTTAAASSIVIVFDDPRTMSPAVDDWAYTRVYTHTSDPGSPPNAAYLVAVGKQTRFEIGGLLPETLYHSRLEHVDEAGNIGLVTGDNQETTQAIGPYHENHDYERGPMNPNSNFGTATLPIASNPPDHWEPVSGGGDVWGAGAGEWWHTSSTHKTGRRALVFNGIVKPGAGTLLRYFHSLPFVVSGDVLLGVNFAWRHDGNSGNQTVWRPVIEWLDEDQVLIGTSVNPVDMFWNYNLGAGITAPANTWIVDRGWKVPVAGARFARLRIEINISVALGQTDHPTMYFDRFVFTRSISQLNWFQSAGTDRAGHASNTWKRPWLDQSPYIDNIEGANPGIPLGPVEHSYDVLSDGQYLIEGHVQWTAISNGTTLIARVQNNGADLSVGPVTVKTGASGLGASVAFGPVALSAGDALDLFGLHTEGVNRTIDNSESYLRILQASTQGSI